MKEFLLPSFEELKTAGHQQRMNVYRKYFAFSRYNRLLIQQTLVKSASDGTLISEVKSMEQKHDRDFTDISSKIKKYGYQDEFLYAAREEDAALQKIIEAYGRRMAQD